MRFLTRTTLSKAFGIVPDLEGITLDHAMERSYRRALFILGDPSSAERHAIEVTSTLARKWQKDNGQTSADEEPKGYYFQPNRAFQIELTSFNKLDREKEKWLSEYRLGQRAIDRETMAVWFIDHIINYGLRRHSMYAAVGMLKVLFNYDYNDIVDVLQYTDSRRWGDFKDKRDRLRRWKKKTFQSLMDWFGDGFLKVQECEESDDLFTEHRFIKQTATDETLAKAFTILRFFTPLKPECPLAQNRNINLRELEAQLRAHAISSSEHAIERERVHIMDHPDDLFYIVKSATDLDVKASAQYLELPDFGLGPDGGGRPPIDRQNLPALAPQQRKNIEQEVLRRKKRISKLALESVIIEVDDKERLELPLQGRRVVQLRLNEGDTLVELRSRDQEVSLPLDSFFVPWNPLIDCEPLRYRTILGSKHQIDFVVTYEQDSFGDLSGAVLEIQYRPLVQEETTRSLFEQLATAFALKNLSQWAIAVFAFLLLGGLAYFYFTSRGPLATQDLSKSGDNSQETAKLPSPLPTVDSRATPSPTQTASPAMAQQQPSRSQKSDVQKYELIARANLLILDEYRKPLQTDRSQRGEEPGKQSSGSYFKIYASRTGLTSLRMKLPEAAPESPDVVSIDNGFFRPLVPGKIESVNNGIVTVTFDLRTMPHKKYYLRVARGDKRPKHYLVKLVNVETAIPKKPDQRRR